MLLAAHASSCSLLLEATCVTCEMGLDKEASKLLQEDMICGAILFSMKRCYSGMTETEVRKITIIMRALVGKGGAQTDTSRCSIPF